MNDTAYREWRKTRYPGYWDYRSPRTAQEYLSNNVRRREARSRRLTVKVQRLLAPSLCFRMFLMWVCVLALLLGGARW